MNKRERKIIKEFIKENREIRDMHETGTAQFQHYTGKIVAYLMVLDL